ncbi:MAG: hypothetical protein MUP66_00105 [Candidatus Nanohaloarchaeota archaeon QJJ-5]|nr:hypothetical protein [Candidatus Nanohaloarchaeota archaeon QJJ-5]
MDVLDQYLDDLRQQRDTLEEITTRYEKIREKRHQTREQYKETVIDALETLQEEIEDPVPLLSVEERGRMDFDYQEILTPDGVETRGGGYHTWDDPVSVETYLDRHYRGTEEHIDLLADRLANLDEDDLPTIRYPINS